MRRFLDYLLLRTPVQRLGTTTDKMVSRAAPGRVSKSRIALSLLGLLLGIVASFYVLGITSSTRSTPAPKAASTVDEKGIGSMAAPVTAYSAAGQTAQDTVPTLRALRWKGFPAVAAISLVICMLTYPGLYRTLRLYVNEPTFLVLFAAFEYGFFWQAVIRGGSELLKMASP